MPGGHHPPVFVAVPLYRPNAPLRMGRPIPIRTHGQQDVAPAAEHLGDDRLAAIHTASRIRETTAYTLTLAGGQCLTVKVAACGAKVVSWSLAVTSADTFQTPSGRVAASLAELFTV